MLKMKAKLSVIGAAVLVLLLSPAVSCRKNGGVNDESILPGIDYAKSFSDYLLSHGMSSRQLEALILSLK